MPEYTEQIVDRDLRISLYEDNSFASAEYRKRIQVVRDGEPVGKPEWQQAPLTQEELHALLGEAAVTQRDHVQQVETQVLQMRADHAAEVNQLNAVIAELNARVAELEAELAE